MSTAHDWIAVTYRVRGPRDAIAARAEALALEQSVELPLAAVHDIGVREHVVARVHAIGQVADDTHRVTLHLAADTTGYEPGQLMNMLFGNASLQEDVELDDVELAGAWVARFDGPRHGIAGWRALAGAHDRALTCSALKPQGLAPYALARLAATFARAGIDVIKDDHGLADQAAHPFAARVRACQLAVSDANARTGGRSIYVPSLSGSLDAMRAQLEIARACRVRAVMIAPMISGVATLAAVAREGGLPILAHPALAGAARIAPPLILGKLFRLFGADASIFPNAGGRFSYTQATCDAIMAAAREPVHGIAPMLPVPAGGMTVERVPALIARYGRDTMLLLGGSLLLAGDHLDDACRAFVRAARQEAT